MEQRSARRAEPIRITDVFEGDALLDETGHELRCTDEAVRFVAPGSDITIPHGEITDVRVDTDKSVAGFTAISTLFAVASGLLVVVFVRTILSPTPTASIVGLGALLAAPLSAFGAVWMRRLEVGERRVLQLDRTDGSRTVFITEQSDGAFELMEARITGGD